jgi:hypothetical protein
MKLVLKHAIAAILLILSFAAPVVAGPLIARPTVVDHSLDEIDRAGPGLVAVGLRCANINLQVCTGPGMSPCDQG